MTAETTRRAVGTSKTRPIRCRRRSRRVPCARVTEDWPPTRHADGVGRRETDDAGEPACWGCLQAFSRRIPFWDSESCPNSVALRGTPREANGTGVPQPLARRLKAARIEAGLTQAAVAITIGKPQSFLAKVESAERRVDVIELSALATVYGKSLDYFVDTTN